MKFQNIITLALALLAFGCSAPAETAQTVEDVLSPIGDTIRTESGLKYVFTKKGSGDPVLPGKKVTSHINLRVNGQIAWSTYEDDKPFSFVASKDPLIEGFDEVASYMKKGDRVLAVIPPEIGYGDAGAGPKIPGNSTLYFDMEVLDVEFAKPYLADTLYAAFEEDGIEGLKSRYATIVATDSANYNMQGNQWGILNRRYANEARMETVVEIMDFHIAEFPKDIMGHYYKAKAYENAGDLANALKVIQNGMQKTNNDDRGIFEYQVALQRKIENQ